MRFSLRIIFAVMTLIAALFGSYQCGRQNGYGRGFDDGVSASAAGVQAIPKWHIGFGHIVLPGPGVHTLIGEKSMIFAGGTEVEFKHLEVEVLAPTVGESLAVLAEWALNGFPSEE